MADKQRSVRDELIIALAPELVRKYGNDHQDILKRRLDAFYPLTDEHALSPEGAAKHERIVFELQTELDKARTEVGELRRGASQLGTKNRRLSEQLESDKKKLQKLTALETANKSMQKELTQLRDENRKLREDLEIKKANLESFSAESDGSEIDASS